jgi:hypothetical protein
MKGVRSTMTIKPDAPRSGGEAIVLSAQVGSERFRLTAAQVRDTVASYLARGMKMPTPTDANGEDPVTPLHIIAEEWLYGNVEAWVNSSDIVQLVKYQHQAMEWIRVYFGPWFPGLED